MSRPRLYAELFAGSFAVGLQLIGGPRLRPPIAYMGAKTSLAPAILGALGLDPGDGADALLLCDAGPWGWAWQALAVPETCRAVAEVLRGWSGEDPTALWRRLAKKPPPAELVDRTASMLWIQGRALGASPVWWSAEGLRMSEGASRGGGDGPAEPRSTRKPDSGSGLRDPATVADRCDAVATFLGRSAGTHGSAPIGGPRGMHSLRPNPANVFSPQVPSIAENADAVADGVAHYLAMQAHAPCRIPIGATDGGWRQQIGERGERAACRGNAPSSLSEAAERALATTYIAVVHGDIDDALALLPGDLDGWVTYLDPPYVGCTAYAADCPRERVVAIARELRRRGAVVVVSEAVPLPELVGDGWHTLEITGARKGQQWKARRIKTEWLTLSRPVVRRFVEQQRLPLAGIGADPSLFPAPR